MGKDAQQYLIDRFSGFRGVDNIWRFSDEILVFEFKFQKIRFALDYSPSQKYLKLIFRNSEAAEFFRVFLLFSEYAEIFLWKNGVIAYVEEEYAGDAFDVEEVVAYLIRYFGTQFNKNYSNLLIISNQKKIIEDQIFLSVSSTLGEKVCGMLKTLERIHDENMSLARFGDGEFALVARLSNNRAFQRNSTKINYELAEVLRRKKDKLLVAITSPLLHIDFWRNFWIAEWPCLSGNFLLDEYGDSFITRPEFFQIFGMDGVNRWKKIWADKAITFIYGDGSRFDPNHELFSNVKEKNFIISKPRDAYEDLDRIISVIESEKRSDMYLLALGQSATILAARLHALGYRALDIGHVNASYDMVFHGAAVPEALPVSR